MALFARVGEFTPSSDAVGGSGSVSLGFRPTALVFWGVWPPLSGPSWPGPYSQVGYATAGFVARTASGGVDTVSRSGWTDFISGPLQRSLGSLWTGEIANRLLIDANARIVVTGIGVDGFTYTWDEWSDHSQVTWRYLAVGGDDVQASVRLVTVPAGSADQTFDVGGLGFLPKAALLLPLVSGGFTGGLAAFAADGNAGFAAVQASRENVNPSEATGWDGQTLQFRRPTSTTAYAVDAELALQEMGVGYVRFRHAANTGSQPAAFAMLALGGDDLAARVARQTLASGVAGEIDLSGLSMKTPLAVLAATVGGSTKLGVGISSAPGPAWGQGQFWTLHSVPNDAAPAYTRHTRGTDSALAIPTFAGTSFDPGAKARITWPLSTFTVTPPQETTVGMLVLGTPVRTNLLASGAALAGAFATATLAGGTVLVQAPGAPSQALATTVASATGFGAALLLPDSLNVEARATATAAFGNAVPFDGVAPGAVVAAAAAEATRLTDPAQTLPAVTVAAASATAATALETAAALAAESAAAASAAGWIWYAWPELLPASGNDVPGTVNYLLDPSYETGIGWEVVSGSGAASTDAWAGSRSLAWSMGTANRTLRIETARGLGFADGATYVGSVRVKGPLDSVQARLEAVYADASVQSGTEAAVAAGADWTLVTTPPLTTDGTKTLDHLRLRLNNTAAGTMLVDGAQVERGTAPTGWCSGALGAPAGTWLGNPDASPSWRQTIRVVNAARTVAEGETVAPAAPVGAGGGRRAAGGDEGARAAARYGAPFGLTGGRGGALRVEAKLYRATWDNRFLEDLSEWVVEGRVEMDTNRDVTWSLDATLLDEGWSRLTPYLDWVAPYLTITYPNGTVSQGQLGLYLVMESPRAWREYGSTVQLTAVDPLWLLNAQGLPSTISVRGDVGRSEFVRSLLAGAVLTQGDVAGSQTNPRRRFWIPTMTLSSGEVNTFGHAVEFEAGMSRLRAINEVLLSAGCSPLYTTKTGVFTTRPLTITLNDRQPARTYAANAPSGWNLENRTDRGLFGDVIDAIDTSPYADGLQNEVLFVNDSLFSPLQVRYRITDSDNRRSLLGGTTGRNRRNTRTVTSRFIRSTEAAALVARAIAEAMSLRNESARVRVVPEPHLELAREVVGLAVFDADGRPVVTGRWAVQRASYGFTPSDAWMELEVARVYGISGVAEAYVPA